MQLNLTVGASCIEGLVRRPEEHMVPPVMIVLACFPSLALKPPDIIPTHPFLLKLARVGLLEFQPRTPPDESFAISQFLLCPASYTIRNV